MGKKLSAGGVKNTKPTSERQEIADTIVPGLYFIVQPSGAKSWAVCYRHNGKPRKHTLGPYPALDLGDARDEGREVLLRVAKGADPAGEKRIVRQKARQRAADGEDDGTFEFGVRNFIRRYAKPKNRSWREAARVLGLVPDPAKRDSDDVDDFVLLKGGIAARWAQRQRSDIRKASYCSPGSASRRFPERATPKSMPMASSPFRPSERRTSASTPCRCVRPRRRYCAACRAYEAGRGFYSRRQATP